MLYTHSDGSIADLTGATAVDFVVQRDPYRSDDDATNLRLTLAAGVTVTDPLSGVATVDITEANSLSLQPYGEQFYYARAVLADGRVIFPDNLRGSFFTDRASALSQADGSSDLMPIPAPSASYPINAYDRTGLTSGAKPLAAFDISAIKTANPIFLVYFTGSILAMYRLRALGSDTATAPWLVPSTVDAAYAYELVKVTKQGADCVWNSDDSKFYQVVGKTLDGAVAQVTANTGFQLPA